MLIVFFKKQVITIVAAIDTKISSLDDKITKNKNKLEDTWKGIVLSFWEIQQLMGQMVFKPI